MTAGIPFAERGGAARGLLDLATLCYPAFLFGGSVGRLLPVFHFHDVTRAWLEPRLQHLADNGYQTVTSDEIQRLVVDGVTPGPRAVALTFDDGWASAWTVATPLLRRFGFRAILFAIPGRMSDAPSVRPTLDDRPLDPSVASAGSPFVTWPELRAMHASGIIDVQSHTRVNAMMFGGAAVTAFVTPAYGYEPVLNRPIIEATGNGGLRVVEPTALGTPLHVRRSRMSDARRFLAEEAVAERCREHVARSGGADFFNRPTWRTELTAIASQGGGTFENDETRAAAIRDELAEGRALLNAGLATSTVRHVALPWGIAGSLTRRVLAETGHLTAFAERPFRVRGVRAGDDRYGLMRLNGNFLTCLPGRGRRWFLTTVR
jgi:hypothetical protein